MVEVNGTYIQAEMVDILQTLKSQLELNGVKRFYKITDTPKNVMVCCPFHKDGQERRPSMGVLKSTGTCHCFSCGWIGTLSEMVSNCFGHYDMGLYGSKWLIRNFSAVSREERQDVELDFGRQNSFNSKRNISSLESVGDTCYIQEVELDKYRYIHPYMYDRKMTDDIIELFDVGYDAETDCLTFPVRDKNGNCLFVARRSVRTKYFNYPAGVEKPLYGIYELQKSMKHYDYLEGNWACVVCESMIDTLTCWSYDTYSVAMNGLGSELQIKQLRQLPCRELIIATDNDEAGWRAKDRLKKALPDKILTQYLLPDNRKDINDLSYEEFLCLKKVFL